MLHAVFVECRIDEQWSRIFEGISEWSRSQIANPAS
jgi:hypothetical protein